MQTKIIYGVIGLIVGSMVTWAFAMSAVNNQNTGMMGMMGFRTTSIGRSNTDRHFIEQMIPHHDDAVTMASLALQKAEHQETKVLAQNIIKGQSDEISQMRQWYKDWYGKDVPDAFGAMGHQVGSKTVHMGMMGNTTDTKSLETANPFDKAFLEEMIPHHQMAIMMAQMLKNSSNRPEMQALADNIIRAQTKEIEQMRTWYNQWYK